MDLTDPSLYINRELSWVRFDQRVLDEALDRRHPLLERLKFLSIFTSNLDEFFMIRMSGLYWQMQTGSVEAPPDGHTPEEQVRAIQEALATLLAQQMDCWEQDLQPALREAGISVLSYADIPSAGARRLREYFQETILPTLTPLAFDAAHPFPHISNLCMNLAIVVTQTDRGERFARLKVPRLFPRLLRMPHEQPSAPGTDRVPCTFVWIEEIIAANLDLLFPGCEVVATYPFRVTRDADPDIEVDEAADLLLAVQESLRQRHFGSAVRLEVSAQMPERIREILAQNLHLSANQLNAISGPLGLSDLIELTKLDRPDLKDPPVPQKISPVLAQSDMFSVIRQRDILLYHPYDSFLPVVDFLRAAAKDPEVLAIKQTLYRVGPDSPVVEALMEARANGKEVATLVELKARFDEEHNILWAKELERAGVHVVYGLVGLKTHAKMCLVVRREGDRLARYVHLSTGNYNPATARVYTDMALFTSNPAIASDVAMLFNALTGYAGQSHYRCLLVAPEEMRTRILDRIERVIAFHHDGGQGYIAFKLNALTDPACIQALYRASQAGVTVDLQVRGICSLRPGVSGVSERITVTSIVGRFLEHSRIFFFRAGHEEELWLGSADLMPRNLDGRVEVLFPVNAPHLRRAIRDDILFVHLRDTAQLRRMDEKGMYTRVLPQPGEPPLDTQQRMLELAGTWNQDGR
ncbi:MAG: polyphosphate kinase 1 [Nitrospirae bacterium]|nr:polyphosphate kinase 1 [Nitrospirota bacterium]